jgi:hypothetical protein
MLMPSNTRPNSSRLKSLAKATRGVGDDHDHRQADQQIATVHGANANRQQGRGERSHDAGQGHHQTGVAGTDTQVAGDVVEHAHRQKLAGHQGEGTHGDRENRQPLLFDTLLVMFG